MASSKGENSGENGDDKQDQPQQDVELFSFLSNMHLNNQQQQQQQQQQLQQQQQQSTSRKRKFLGENSNSCKMATELQTPNNSLFDLANTFDDSLSMNYHSVAEVDFLRDRDNLQKINR